MVLGYTKSPVDACTHTTGRGAGQRASSISQYKAAYLLIDEAMDSVVSGTELTDCTEENMTFGSCHATLDLSGCVTM